MKDFLLKFGVPSNNIFHLQDPSEHATNQAYIDLVEKLLDGRKCDPPEDFLVIHIFSANGLQVNGMQSIMFNDYDEENKFYRLFEAENLLRELSNEFSNLYQIGIFTSSRKQTGEVNCMRRPNARSSTQVFKKKLDDLKQGVKSKKQLRKLLDAAGAPEDIFSFRESQMSYIDPNKQPRKNIILLFSLNQTILEEIEHSTIKDLINLLMKRLDR